ncbi:hypothetical protein AMATHDRAFT_158617 [Amanita thiersii Skay4041]|uniref:WW domain-containing protein n=1 Tax=Amanita thiersii Skay4041 TaxID=703135 RepID=A0A2A9ND02_9AGAR|nr:hypothetical protein AMATHDRAFT_158617 [Amanita thiersii Skay4041]
MSNNHLDAESTVPDPAAAEEQVKDVEQSDNDEQENERSASVQSGTKEKSASASSPDSRNEDEEEQTSDDNDTGTSGSVDKGQSPATSIGSGGWQAIYSPQYNAYYFYNNETQETTWTNPLALPDSASTPASAPASDSTSESGSQVASTSTATDKQYNALQQAALAQGIDPSLAYLDPSLASSHPSSSAVGPGGLPTFTAKFNARTGQFTRPEGRDPTHLSEYERMRRMSDFYFDVNAWEHQLADQGGSIKGDDSQKKRKRPSKKDLERFKEQKRLKKIAKTAWLRT